MIVGENQEIPWTILGGPKTHELLMMIFFFPEISDLLERDITIRVY
jgi:hypothetical protein